MENNTSQNMQGLWIDLDILKDSNLSLQEKFVLAIIKALDKGNGCFASNKYFAELLQVTSKRVSDIISSLVTKEYVVSEIENFYKRTLRINKKEEIDEKEIEKLEEETKPKEAKRKPIMWRGMDLSTWGEEAIERLKKRFKEVEVLLSGGTIDESIKPVFRTNEEIFGTYKEEPSEWQGINQLVLTT